MPTLRTGSAPGSAAVLAALCRHTVAARRVGSWLARLEEGDKDLNVELWLKLLGPQERESAAVSSLATRLRLTPQSRYRPRAAATAGSKPGADVPRPWEI